jgi:hypothetical protein
VPVVVSDELELPFEDVLDYTQFAVFVPAARAVQPGYLAELLRNVTRTEWEAKWQRLKEVGLRRLCIEVLRLCPDFKLSRLSYKADNLSGVREGASLQRASFATLKLPSISLALEALICKG